MPKIDWTEREETQSQEHPPLLRAAITTELLKRDIKTLSAACGFIMMQAKRAGHLLDEVEFQKTFKQSHQNQSTNQFSEHFKWLSLAQLRYLASAEKLDLPDEIQPHQIAIDARDINPENLQQYLADTKQRAVICVTQLTDSEKLTANNKLAQHPELNINSAFAIHSVAKMMTGALMLRMLELGIISTQALTAPPVLDPAVLKKLPESVQAHLTKCTLHQLMTHQSGLGDYLDNYIAALKQGKASDALFPTDFLQFADSDIFANPSIHPKTGVKEQYSNLGILLVGLVIENAYNRFYQAFNHAPKDFTTILRETIINPAGITQFHLKMPSNATYNEQDSTAAQIVGTPAGGYWMTAADLSKFGAWLIAQTERPYFLKLLEEYGSEFYDKDRKIIAHSGSIESSSAQLNCYLETNTAVAILSDRNMVAKTLIVVLEDHLARDQMASPVARLEH